ncbi:MAG: 2-oxoacid:acceptor oxidoreductase subunit alpha [Alphaproteobacteria bacterium]|nr:2-oxoacid:acceptor oxidoreductase subunit alpha [Alphaproteobacteria bacterium]
MNEAVSTPSGSSIPRQVLDAVVVRFAGDSGDGMQLTGSQFTRTTAFHGNDLATFPDFPAEIRAPAGTLAGVSGFQIHFSSREVHTPGDQPAVLIAMNPAALAANIADLKAGGLVIVNTDKFTKRDLEKADLTSDPLEDGSLSGFQVVPVQLSTLTKNAVESLGLGAKETDRCKNFFALGMTYWLFSRDMALTEEWIQKKFKPPYDEANLAALRAGYNFADTVELFHSGYEVPPAKLAPGTYRNITGNQALALGLVAAAQLAGRPLFQGAYPITPASDVLHYLSTYKDFGVVTFQAEDEIAAIAATIGAAWGGSIAVTTTSGPGVALKGEALGLGVMVELPMVLVDIQRGGPSTGLPTKTEQSDLNIAIYGRHGESPAPVIAAQTPGDCFYAAIEAVRVAVKHMIPVILLTDGYLANGAAPWKLPDVASLAPIPVKFADGPSDGQEFRPYERDPQTLARPWAIPGTPGAEHRIGGLEKQEGTGNVSYNPDNHHRMTEIRQAKVDRIAADLDPVEVYGDDGGLLVVSWGGTFGSVRAAVDAGRTQGMKLGHLHLRWLNPMPPGVAEALARYDRVLVPELNMGQLAGLLRQRFLVDTVSFPKVQGKPFKVSELLARFQTLTSPEA